MAFYLGEHLSFLDSFQFMSSSLAKLADNLPNDKFICTKEYFPDERHFKLMREKGVYPYDYMDSPSKFNDTRLPKREDFYSLLTDEDINDDDYQHAEGVWNTFGIKNMGEYHDLYLKSDILLLADVFENFRETCYYLGMSIKRDRERRTLMIRQPNYVEKVLRKFGMENCKPVSTPLEPGRKFQKLSPSDEPFDVQTYQQAIGCLTYVSTATRPDISAAVLSRYMSRPSKDHWIGVKRVLRYLKGTLKYGLKFTAHEEEPELYGYSDADWAGDVDTRRSTSGYVFQVGSSTVSWSSRKQGTVAKSSTES